MLIKVKNKDTLIFDDFIFRCVLGKEEFLGTKEGDFKTPRGLFKLNTQFTIELIELKIYKLN